MDLVIRYFDDDAGKVMMRYLGSEFLGHTTSADLLVKFKDGVRQLIPRCLIQISMNGPNVNWKFLGDLKENREEEYQTLPDFINLGSCGLHSVHGSLQHGANETGWKVGQLLRAFWQLFHDSPTRRENYVTVTGSNVFPLKFCRHRWVEDLGISERAVLIWPNVKFTDHYKGLPENKVPNSALFLLVKEQASDSLYVAKA